MIWDSPLTAAVARELNDRLSGARLRAHSFRWEDRELILYFREETLRWSLHPRRGWVTLHPAETPPEGARPLSAHVVAVEAAPDERVVQFRLRKLRGRRRDLNVTVELMMNQWNALLVEGEEGWIRHLLWTREGDARALRVGQAYQPPEPSRRVGVEAALSMEEWLGHVSPGGESPDRAHVLDTVAFTSPLNLPALLDEAAEVEGRPPRLDQGYRAWLRLRNLDHSQPCILARGTERQPYPIPLSGFECSRSPTVLDAIRELAGGPAPESGSERDALGRLEKLIHQALGRVRGIQREMNQAGDPQTLREQANLLLARLGSVEKGTRRVTLSGFRGEEITLELDPSKSPHENADALYREAARRERALKKLPTLLKKARATLEEMEALREDFLTGGVGSAELKAGLPGEDAGKARWAGSRPGSRIPFRRFRSSGGLEIRVGRGPKDNEALTFRHSSPDDVWLHARDASGAHVVLRWTGEDNPPAKDLAEAACLAALHSAARDAGVVPVDWTRRKHVRKPRRAPPGTVTIQHARTLFVEPDQEVARRLSWEG